MLMSPYFSLPLSFSYGAHAPVGSSTEARRCRWLFAFENTPPDDMIAEFMMRAYVCQNHAMSRADAARIAASCPTLTRH